MPFGAAIAAGGALFGGSKQRKADKKAQKRAIEASKATPASANLGFGTTAVDAQGNITQEGNQFTDLSRLFANQATQSLGQAGAIAIDPSQTGITQQSVGGFNQAIANQFGNLAGAIGSQPQFDPNAFAATQFDRLQSLASRGEEIGANRLAGSLFSRGRLGANDTFTGEAFGGLARAQEDARTNRALQATSLANQEAQRLFQQNQVGVQNQFGLLSQLAGQGQNQFGNLLGQGGFNQAFQQQQLQNALGFGGGAGSVLQPNFQTLTAVLNRQATDQASRSGVASSVGNIIAQGGQNQANLIGNAFAGIGGAVADRVRTPIPSNAPTGGQTPTGGG